MIKKVKIVLLLLVLFTTAIICSENSRPTVGLVLSGGGARGFAHIGVLKVLDSLNIEVDYIAGTSMGSIIGGLYAIGFDANEIDSITSSIDWNSIFNDDVNRNDMTFEEKKYSESYFFGIQMPGLTLFPPGLNITLPMGLVYGQRIQSILNEETWKVKGYNNFNEFPIPFISIAADILNAKVKILDRGDLSTAIRASMSLKAILHPVELENCTLVDGGYISNLPALELDTTFKPDIIIGVDISTPPKNTLNSAIDIMGRISGFRNAFHLPEHRNRCNILITPDLNDMSTSAFGDFKKFIELGKSSDNWKIQPESLIWDYLAMLIDTSTEYNEMEFNPESLNFYIMYNLADFLKNFPVDPESLYFSEIEIVNINNTSPARATINIVEEAFPNIPRWLDRKQISARIDSIEAKCNTSFFDIVTYSINKGIDSNTLVIKVMEFNPESLYFNELEIVGYNNENLSNDTRNLVKEAFPDIPCWLDRKQISEGIEKIYNTLYFDFVSYTINKGFDGNTLVSDSDTLVIEVKEKDRNYLNIGGGYNSYDNVKWIINGTFRNFISKSLKLILNLKFMKHFSFEFDLYLPPHQAQAWRLNFISSGGYNQNDLYLYENRRSYARLLYSTLYLKERFIFIFGNNLQFNIGGKFNYIRSRPEIAPPNLKVEYNTYGIYFANIAYDNLRTLYYPKQGLKSLVEFRCISSLSGPFIDFIQGVFDISFYIPFHRKITFFNGIYAGFTRGENDIPANFNFYTGGFRASQCGNAVYGYNRNEISGKQLVSFRTGLQYEPWNNRYIILQLNAAKTFDDPYQFNEFNNYLYGHGLKIGFKLPAFGLVDLGYIDFAIAGKYEDNFDNYRKNVKGYFSIGNIF